MRTKLSAMLFTTLLWAGFVGVSPAQNTNSGDISGIVTDTTGAAVPGVAVTVLNIATGVSKDYVTNDAGVYDTGSIVAGTYKLTFAKSGFSTLVRSSITVIVGPTTVNAQLSVGGVNAGGRGQYRHTAPENRKRRAVRSRFPRKTWQHFLKWGRTGPNSVFSFQDRQGLPAARRVLLQQPAAPHPELRSQSMAIFPSARYWQTGQRQPSPPAQTPTSSLRRRSRNFSSAPRRSLRSTASAASCTTRSVKVGQTNSTDHCMSIFKMKI